MQAGPDLGYTVWGLWMESAYITISVLCLKSANWSRSLIQNLRLGDCRTPCQHPHSWHWGIPGEFCVLPLWVPWHASSAERQLLPSLPGLDISKPLLAGSHRTGQQDQRSWPLVFSVGGQWECLRSCGNENREKTVE